MRGRWRAQLGGPYVVLLDEAKTLNVCVGRWRAQLAGHRTDIVPAWQGVRRKRGERGHGVRQKRLTGRLTRTSDKGTWQEHQAGSIRQGALGGRVRRAREAEWTQGGVPTVPLLSLHCTAGLQGLLGATRGCTPAELPRDASARGRRFWRDAGEMRAVRRRGSGRAWGRLVGRQLRRCRQFRWCRGRAGGPA